MRLLEEEEEEEMLKPLRPHVQIARLGVGCFGERAMFIRFSLSFVGLQMVPVLAKLHSCLSDKHSLSTY
jgi:hypothetical protein